MSFESIANVHEQIPTRSLQIKKYISIAKKKKKLHIQTFTEESKASGR